MSFLRKMFGGTQDSDPRRFVIEAMLGAIEADGQITDEEMDQLQTNLDGHELFEGITGEQTSRMMDRAADDIRRAGGGDKRVQAIAEGLPSRGHRMTAYAMACQICVSDSELPPAEVTYLEMLQRAMQLGDDEARDIFEAARANSGLLTLEEKTQRMRQLMPRFVDCMALMASADGQVHEQERAGIRGVLSNIPDMSVLSTGELDEAINTAFARLESKQVDQEIQHIAQEINHPADRYWTMVYMMIVALSDGKTDWREVAFLKTAESAFALSDTQMDMAMENARLFPAAELGGQAPLL